MFSCVSSFALSCHRNGKLTCRNDALAKTATKLHEEEQARRINGKNGEAAKTDRGLSGQDNHPKGETLVFISCWFELFYHFVILRARLCRYRLGPLRKRPQGGLATESMPCPRTLPAPLGTTMPLSQVQQETGLNTLKQTKKKLHAYYVINTDISMNT